MALEPLDVSREKRKSTLPEDSEVIAFLVIKGGLRLGVCRPKLGLPRFIPIFTGWRLISDSRWPLRQSARELGKLLRTEAPRAQFA
ncbi:MAG: hypothetical protein ACKV22_01890 [Bryobacteraceae bacterium]